MEEERRWEAGRSSLERMNGGEMEGKHGRRELGRGKDALEKRGRWKEGRVGLDYQTSREATIAS